MAFYYVIKIGPYPKSNNGYIASMTVIHVCFISETIALETLTWNIIQACGFSGIGEGPNIRGAGHVHD